MGPSRADGFISVEAFPQQGVRAVAKQYPQVHIGPAYTWDHGVHRLQFNLSLELPDGFDYRTIFAEAHRRLTSAADDAAS